MTRIDVATPGAPCWLDLFTSDAARAEEFYGRLFGWTARRLGPDLGDYVNFLVDDLPVAGMVGHDGTVDHPDGWTVYLATADAAATAAAAVAAGGRTIVEPTRIADLGTVAMLVDPGGAPVGLWQPGTFPGTRVLVEPGAPAWFELTARAAATAVDFYRRVFGCDTAVVGDTDDSRRTWLLVGGEPRAGIRDRARALPAQVPANWQVHFGVVDVDAAVDLVIELGGAVRGPAVDSPSGRLAQVADPTGAVFRLVGVPAG